MLAGRLADPNCSLGTDPRSDPRMVAAFAPLGLADVLPDAPLTVDSPIEDRLAYCAAAEEAIGGVLDVFALAAAAPAGVTTTTVTIAGGDDNELTLFVSRPDRADGALPALVHLHGGGMAIGSAADAAYRHLRESLAASESTAGLMQLGLLIERTGRAREAALRGQNKNPHRSQRSSLASPTRLHTAATPSRSAAKQPT